MFCSLNISCFALVSNAWFIRCRVWVSNPWYNISAFRFKNCSVDQKINWTTQNAIWFQSFDLILNKNINVDMIDILFVPINPDRFCFSFIILRSKCVDNCWKLSQYSTVDNVWINFYSNSILRGIISFAKHVEACVHNLNFGVFLTLSNMHALACETFRRNLMFYSFKINQIFCELGDKLIFKRRN